MIIDLPCPACGFNTFEEIYGSYVICEVCGWEDDGVQLGNPCFEGGANVESLVEAQENALKKYPFSVQDVDGFKRGKKWRPLTSNEKNHYIVQIRENHKPNEEVSNESEAYWKSDT